MEKEQDNIKLTKEQLMIYQNIMKVLCNYSGVDFSQYRENTLLRRIERRMGMLQVKEISEYLDVLLTSEEERENLYQDVLIGVTDFFRDTEAFEHLKELIYNQLILKNYNYNYNGVKQEIRVWSVACSTGEEAYSLAMMIAECVEQTGFVADIKIFATDIDKRAITKAQSGCYTEEQIMVVPKEYVLKYFDKQESYYKAKDVIRKMVVFAQHDILKDAPFFHMDLVVCRNMFIYVKREVQNKLLITFYKVLKENGFLFLGNSESLCEFSDLFETINSKWKIYKKDATKEQIANQEYIRQVDTKNFYSAGGGYKSLLKSEESNRMMERILTILEESTRFVNSNGEVMRMVTDTETVASEDTNENEITRESHIKLLEQELQESHERLQVVIEELETKNEELQSTNEEMIVSNEELQSTNEELQSVNEELYTVNAEYQEKIDELVKSNADLDNLLVNAEIGALYIDHNLCIRKITPIMAKNTNLLLSDTGRPIRHVNFMDGYRYLAEDAEKSMRDICVVEREIQTNGKTWMVRLKPYYLVQNQVSGVVVTLFDITRRLEAAKYELRALTDSIPGGVVKLRYDNGLIVEYANEGMYQMMQITPEDFYQHYHNHYEAVMDGEDWLLLQDKIDECLKERKMLKAQYRVKHTGRSEEWREIQAVVLESGDKPVLQCVITDVTESIQVYRNLEKEHAKLDVIARLSGNTIFEYDIVNDYMQYTATGEGMIDKVQVNEHYFETIIHSGNVYPEDSNKLSEFCRALRRGEPEIHVELRRKYEDGLYHWIEIEGTTIKNYNGEPWKVIGKFKNIDAQVQREQEYKKRSEIDSLTGVYNHRTIVDKITERLEMLTDHRKACLLVCDMDNFKQINDINGHLVGDAVLCSFSEVIQKEFIDGMVGRIGGDEFVIYVEDVTQEELLVRMQHVSEGIYRIYSDTENGLKVTSSTGAVYCDDSHKCYDELFRWADYALYQVKSGEKGNIRIVTSLEGTPEAGYITEHRRADDYVRRNELIRNADELLYFTLELFENVSDIYMAFRMIFDRVCSFFDLDEIACLRIGEQDIMMEYYWDSVNKRQKVATLRADDRHSWEQLLTQVDEDGMLILHHEETFELPGATVGSIVMEYAPETSEMDGKLVLLYIDRENDRAWEAEREILHRISGIILNRFRMIYANKIKEDEIDDRLNFDPVTRLPYYGGFLNQCDNFISSHKKEYKYGFFYVDFTNFKYLNDIYGYTEGDKLLSRYAGVLKSKFLDGILFSRVTSDHFVGFFNYKKKEKTIEVLNQINLEFCNEMNERYERCNLSVSCGIYWCKDENEILSTQLDYANVARKYAKAHHKVTAQQYDEKIRERDETERLILSNMSEALEEHQFEAWLQPKVSIETGKIVGAEALVRWRTKDGKLWTPGKFIPVFEKNGFVTKLDFEVFDQVLAFLNQGLESEDEVVPISVNFSRLHNETQSFVPNILSKMEQYQVPSHYVEVEITENIFMQDLYLLKKNLEELRKHKIGVSLDDFGSEFSSLNVLASVHVDVIKLDKRFLDSMGEKENSQKFITNLVDMIKRMGYRVVAEGVETKEQLTLMQKAGCDMIQGYYYAKPMPMSEFKEFIRRFNQK